MLVNEDFPSLPDSSRTACLDAVESCDIFLLIVDRRGGYRTPSGKLVVEEELEHAQRCKLPVLVFVREGTLDEAAQALANRVSDYVDGHLRKTFESPEQLEELVAKALGPLKVSRQVFGLQQQIDLVQATSKQTGAFQSRTTLRVVFCPERREEVFDPVRLDSDELASALLEIGNGDESRLLSSDLQERRERTTESLVVHQLPPGIDAGYYDLVRIEVFESGLIVVDANVTRRVDRSQGDGLMDLFVLAQEDVEEVLRRAFTFVGTLYERFDPYKRHQRFLVNASLAGVGRRTLVRDPQPQPGYGSNSLYGIQDPVSAYGTPRLIARADLCAPQAEIGRLISKFRHAIQAAQPAF